MSQIHIEQEPGSEIRVPRWALASMAGLMVVTMVLAGTARLTGMGSVSGPDARLVAADPGGVELVFEAREGDALAVRAGVGGAVLRELAAGEGGFLRGVLRPLERERVRLAAELDAPYRLVRAPEGSLALLDPETGVVVDLAAFGRTSVAAFDGLWTEAAGSD